MSRICISETAERFGVRENRINNGAISYAQELAKYISDPSTIRARTMNYWGHAPTLEACAKFREQHERERAGFKAILPDATPCDQKPFRVTMLCGPAPVERVRAERPVLCDDVPEPEPEPLWTPPDPLPLLPRDIITTIAAAFGRTYEDVTGPRRGLFIMPTRNTCYYVLRQRGMSLPKIGSFLGGRDHTAVRNGILNFEHNATPKMREVAAAFAKRDA